MNAYWQNYPLCFLWLVKYHGVKYFKSCLYLSCHDMCDMLGYIYGLMQIFFINMISKNSSVTPWKDMYISIFSRMRYPSNYL